jgi:hypothetical protein
LDGGEASLGNKVGVEFYTKDRVKYLVVSSIMLWFLAFNSADRERSLSRVPSRSLSLVKSRHIDEYDHHRLTVRSVALAQELLSSYGLGDNQGCQEDTVRGFRATC